MAKQIALVDTASKTVVRIYDKLPDFVDVPGGTREKNVSIGWTSKGGGYTLAEIEPFAPPEGKVIDGPVAHTVKPDGSVQETAAVADAPPRAFSPREILTALQSWGVGEKVLEGMKQIDVIAFVLAPALEETDPALLAILKSAGKTVDDLNDARNQ